MNSTQEASASRTRSAESSDGIGGVYLDDNDVAVIDDTQRPLTPNSIPADASSAMLDPDDAQRLWALTEELLD